ncbi:MAG: N-6 DNA methylase [bacterium]
MNKTEAKEKIKILVQKFEKLTVAEKRSYNEAMTRKDFIVPLFDALGWDVYSNEVVEEEPAVEGTVDYSFKLNNISQFLLEAKGIKVDLDKIEWAKQAVNYGWNMGIEWVILTDFEGLKLFNASWEVDIPHPNLEFSYKEYLDRFEDLWLFSKESFQTGELDKQTEKWGIRIKRVNVTEKLANDLIGWRKELFDNFFAWNKNKSENEIDEAVQRILDRFIFIRCCEDRKIESAVLWSAFQKWTLSVESNNFEHNFLKTLKQVFRDFDEKYNSNLFKKHFCEDFDTEGSPFSKIINGLYGDARSGIRYNFAVINPDILGKVYEQYLGHLLRKSGKKGEDLGKTKRKKQGIYYTPTFIVDYIVKNALGPVLDKCKNVHDLKKIKVLDPACGSGSFLIKALEMINEKYKKFGAPGNTYTKIQILQENIYGVDLDEQAVEIARLNLLINSLSAQVKLPLLSNNIKNGNSLISGTDEELTKYFGKNFRDKKPFNWQEEFPEVFKQGGFDVIIGNPPYIKEFVNKSAFDSLHNSPYYQGKMDIWTMFSCIAIDLLKEGGILSFIAPNNWVSNAGASIFRDKVLKGGGLKSFVDFGDYKIFEDAGIQTMIFVFEKRSPNKKYSIDYLKINNKDLAEDRLVSGLFSKKTKINIEPEKLFGKNITFGSSEVSLILDKIQSKKNFELTDKEVGQGIVAAPDKYFLEKRIDFYIKEEQKFLKKFYTASGRYKSGDSNNYIFYICDKNFGDKNIKDYPNIQKHFKPFEGILKKAKIKYGTPDKVYFYLHREREEKFFNDGPKIVCGVRVKQLSFYYTDKQYYGSRALNFIKSDRISLKYLTGILNSRVAFFWLKNKGKQLGDLLQIDKGPLLNIPIFIGNKDQQEKVANLVDKITQLNKEIHKIQENSEKWNSIKSEIEKTDKKIDEDVYNLYGLTPEEIKVVEK